MRATLPVFALLLHACQCAQLPDIPFRCEPSTCGPSQRCTEDGRCVEQPDGGGTDAGSTGGGPSDAGAMPDAGLDGGLDAGCVPSRTCQSAGAECGVLDDGCGTVSCGVCGAGSTCGVSMPNRCAPCVPGSADEPDDAFLDSNCDGLDGVADGGLFVDPRFGNDSNAGTREAPLRSLGAALQRAPQQGAHAIFASDGDFDEHVAWSAPISVYGGYRASLNWARSSTPSSRALIRRGLTAQGLPSSVVLDRVSVSQVDAVQPGEASITLRLLDSPISLRHLIVEAGRGANGSAGTPGDAGSPGGPGLTGGPGSPGRVGCMLSSCQATLAAGGAGGPSACGNGARGNNSGRNDPLDGMNLDYISRLSECLSCPCQMPLIADDGQVGPTGTDGMPGQPGLVRVGRGTLANGMWTPVTGDPGTDGQPGEEGGGGGAGGQVTLRFQASTDLPFVVTGPGGSGGGGRGCGGAAGGPGQPGGASIAIAVSGRPPSFTAVTVLGNSGGTGGPGGSGGQGGQGGSGGPSRLGYRAACNQASIAFDLDLTTEMGTFSGMASGAGGQGGAGGRGGAGGPGAPGIGGPSVAIWCDSTVQGLDAGAVTFMGGASGASGPLPDGGVIAGVAEHVVGCQ
ncbi:MAG: hypothetical protein JNM69_38530 [Archangium sp.]|nr:hypothetical protein [Archangium sp.]